MSNKINSITFIVINFATNLIYPYKEKTEYKKNMV